MITLQKCKQCHYWNFINGANKCNCVYGDTGHTEGDRKVCGAFDYWRNYEHLMSVSRQEQFLKISEEGEILDDGQVDMFLYN